MARLIDANALMLYLNDIYFRNSPNGNSWRETLEIKQYRESVCEGLEMAMKSVEEAPTVCGWISIKDRLPEEHADEHPYEFEQYLCVTVWNYVRTIGFGTRIGDDKPHFWSGNSIWDDWVTHWMPFPEPPKEVNNG